MKLCVLAGGGALITLMRDALLTRNRAETGQLLIKTHVRDVELNTTLNPTLSLLLKGLTFIQYLQSVYLHCKNNITVLFLQNFHKF